LKGQAARRVLEIRELVRRDDNGFARLNGSVQEFGEGRLALGVEANERFVDEQHREGPHESEKQGRLLSQPAAEARWQVIGSIRQVERIEEDVGRLRPTREPVKRADVFDMLAHAEVAVQAWLVANEGECRAGFDRSSPMSTDADRAARRVEQAGCEAQERRLSGTVCAHDGE
jgi:hypothetical protein